MPDPSLLILIGVRKPLNHPSYKSINSAWNHENYWLNKEGDEEWKNSKSLDLMDETKWIRFVCDMELPKKNIEEGQGDSPKRLLQNLFCWLQELIVPKDCFELMYRLGQKTAEFKNVTLEYFAPYLLKDGMVQRVSQFKTLDDEKSTLDDLEQEDSRQDDFDDDMEFDADVPADDAPNDQGFFNLKNSKILFQSFSIVGVLFFVFSRV